MKPKCKTCPFAAKCAPLGPHAMFAQMAEEDSKRTLEALGRKKGKSFDAETFSAVKNMAESQAVVSNAAKLYNQLPEHCELYSFVQKWGAPKIDG